MSWRYSLFCPKNVVLHSLPDPSESTRAASSPNKALKQANRKNQAQPGSLTGRNPTAGVQKRCT